MEKNYKIYHKTSETNFDMVGEVEATTLQEAFQLSNNIFDNWNKEKPCRSTSIGDVIEVEGVSYEVQPIGFTMLEAIDISNEEFVFRLP